MGSSFRVARIMGISVEIHPSWLVIGFLIAYSLATFVLPGQSSGWSDGTYWIVGIAGSVLFLLSVLAHELSHAFAARRFGVRISSITLFVFGGASTMEAEPEHPRDEALIAAAGPASSIAIGVILTGIAIVVTQEQVSALLGWLGFVNLLLGVFNLIPGFPMDGGRVLRALIWRLRGDRYAATRNAALVGQLIGYLIIAFGVLMAFSPGGIVAGIWFALIGWFLSSAAEQASAQTGVERSLHGVKVRDIMDTDPPSVGPNETVAELVHERMLRGEQRTFLVRHLDGGLAGIVSLSDVRPVPRDNWEHARVTDIMTRYADLATIGADQPVEDAMKLMQERGVNQLPVVGEARVVTGLLTRAGIMRLIETRLRLGV